MTAQIRSRRGAPVTTLDAWEALASTEGKWADGFSAKELARLWLDGTGPSALTELLHPWLPDLQITDAVAEAQVAFDAYQGGVRNHDVLARGHSAIGPVVVGVEGKVNEQLDDTIDGKYATAAALRAAEENTNLDLRVNELLDTLAGRRVADDAALGALRYQLFSGVAATWPPRPGTRRPPPSLSTSSGPRWPNPPSSTRPVPLWLISSQRSSGNR